jgi:hypothetical protein
VAQVFVSYSRRDSGTVDQIVTRLIDLDFEIWIDRENIKGGSLWRVEIVEAIDNAQAFVIMLSPSSAKSENVRKEIDLAESSNCKLFPVRLAPVILPSQLRYQLAGIQWIDYGSDPEGKFRELVEVLRNHLSKVDESRIDETTKQAEVVIEGVNLARFGQKEQEKLLNYIAKITATPRADLSLVKVSAGSVHVFIRMPAHSAYVLKTAALNRDRRLLDQGIDAVRLAGDQNFVQLRAKKHSAWTKDLLTRLIEKAELSQTQLEILQLDWEGWSSGQIAREMRIDVEAVYARRSEGLLKLAKTKHLEERLKFDEEDLSVASGHILEVLSQEFITPKEIDEVSEYLVRIHDSLILEADKAYMVSINQDRIKHILSRIQVFRNNSQLGTKETDIERKQILQDLQKLFHDMKANPH